MRAFKDFLVVTFSILFGAGITVILFAFLASTIKLDKIIHNEIIFFILILCALFLITYRCMRDIEALSGYKSRPLFGIALVIVFIALPLIFKASYQTYLNRKFLASPNFAFNGQSQDLSRTKIIATLDEPFPNGVNVIWCASFLSAWKTQQNDFLKEPIKLKNSLELVSRLNNAADFRSFIPAEGLYTAIGAIEDNIVDKINHEVKQRFPHKASPAFLPPASDTKSVISYAYLEVNLPFATPYSQDKITFTDSQDLKTSLSAFGVLHSDTDYHLRKQPQILFIGESDQENKEFVIDLDATSQPNQIIVAKVPLKQTIEETIGSVENKISANSVKPSPGLGSSDTLLVPEIVFNLSHRFSELEGLHFENARLAFYHFGVAQQDILFRLDRNGAFLQSGAWFMDAPDAAGRDFIFDQPFLVYMKKRGTKMPYFAMWVDNAELLGKWSLDNSNLKR